MTTGAEDQGGNMGGMVFGGSAFEVGDARAVDGDCALGVSNGDGTVANETVAEETFEMGLSWATKTTVENEGVVGLFEFTGGETAFVLVDCGHKREGR